MVEPTLQTTTTPFDRQSRAEWRTRVTGWLGVSSVSAAHQTEIDRIIDSSHEFISQRLGHSPVPRRVTTLSLVADQSRYAMPADFRHLMDILEGTGGNLKKTEINTQEQWLDGFPSSAAGTTASHQWTDQNSPHWVYRGMDDSDPPVKVYQRVPTPTEAGTNNVTVHYRSYQELMTATNFGEIDPAAQEAMVEHIRAKHALYRKQVPLAQAHFAAREDELRALAVNDNKEDEKPIVIQPPNNLINEMNLYDNL